MNHTTSPVTDFSEDAIVAASAELVIDRIKARLISLPTPGKPAADLTDREKLALAFHLGVPCSIWNDGASIELRSLVPFGVADRGDGGWVVAWSQRDMEKS